GPGARDAWNGISDRMVATGQFLGAGETALYTVTVNATVAATDAEAGTPAITCQPGEPGTPGEPGGFGNNSHVGLAGEQADQPATLRGAGGALAAAPGDQQGSQDAYACAEPTTPEVTKTFVSAMQHAGDDGTWDGTWDVTYTLTV